MSQVIDYTDDDGRESFMIAFPGLSAKLIKAGDKSAIYFYKDANPAPFEQTGEMKEEKAEGKFRNMKSQLKSQVQLKAS